MAGAIGNGIIMVLSPAKTMDLRPLNRRDFGHDGVAMAEIVRLNGDNDCRLCDETFSAKICDVMKGKTEGELRSMLNLSTKLSKVAREFWADFDLGEKEGGADDAASDADYRPAMFTFSGPAYQGLSPSTCDGKTMGYLASRLFIIDPVYGVLRALQGIHPYRLEMASRPFPREDEEDANLASRWRRRVSIYLEKELTRIRASSRLGDEGEEGDGGPILVNLASEEYSSCIDTNLLPRNAIFLNVVFLHAGRVISVHAKRARGSMARYLAEVGARTLRDVCDFDREGYRCVAFADGNMWKEDTGKKCDNDAKIVRVIFDRDIAKSDAKRSTPDSKKQNASTKKTKKL